MSGMLLCRNRRVTEPYYVEELGLSLYSGEELSYYIYHNAPLIDADFLGERLYRFIGSSLGMENLEKKLRKWADQAELPELLLVILQDIHYYDGDELYEFREEMNALSRLSPGRRLLKKADMLFARGRYSAAEHTYGELLEGDYPERKDPEFRGLLRYSLGMTSARQYLWQDAADSLVESLKDLRRPEVREALWQIRKIAPDVKIPDRIFADVPPSRLAEWDADFSSAKEQAGKEGKAAEAAGWMDKDNIRRAYGLRELVRQWKNEYRISLGGT